MLFRSLKFSAAKGADIEERFVQFMGIVNSHCLPLTMVPGEYSDDELRRIDMPTLLLIGDGEKIYNPHQAIERAERLMSDLTAEIIPNCSHLLIMEQPEIVNDRVLRFLKEPD